MDKADGVFTEQEIQDLRQGLNWLTDQTNFSDDPGRPNDYPLARLDSINRLDERLKGLVPQE